MLRKIRRRKRTIPCQFVVLCFMVLTPLLLIGCVEQTLGPDRNAYLGSQIVIISTCTPEDPGTYIYKWSCTQKPAGSDIPDEFSTSSAWLIFEPDRIGLYEIECMVTAGSEGIGTSTITITGIDSRWHITPEILDFTLDPFLSTRIATVENTGVVPLTVTVDRESMNTADWIIDIVLSDTHILPDTEADLSVTVDRNQCGGLRGSYFLLNFIKEESEAIIGSSRVNVVVEMSGNCAPVAEAGPDQTVALGETVLLNGDGSTDVDGDELAYTWSFSSVPPESQTILSGGTTVNPMFIADVIGEYVVGLEVQDPGMETSFDTITITTGNSRPVADAGADQNVVVGDIVLLDGSASYDADGDTILFAWEFISLPAGSSTELLNNDTSTPTFVVDRAGEYFVRLNVNDGSDSSADIVTLSAASQ